MRIVSLLPSTTELCAALGLLDSLVGVTHECDYPPAVRTLPHVTRSLLPEGLDHAAIDRAVRERVAAGQPLYALDWELIAALEPDLILTQALCPVCAVAYDDVCMLAATLPSQPDVLAVEPHTLDDVVASLQAVGAITGRATCASAVAAALSQRITWITKQCAAQLHRPRVVCLEWLDPPFIAGHWVPEMVERAGGIDVLGLPGQPSFTVEWETIANADPEVLIIMPCGYDAHASAALAQSYWPVLEHAAPRATQMGHVYAVDASSYFSRPGPRLVTGLALLAHLLHPTVLSTPSDGHSAIAVFENMLEQVP